MFFLKALPTARTLQNLTRRYPDLDPSAWMSGVELMRTGSDMLAAWEKILGRSGLSQGRFLTLIVLNRDPEEEISPSEPAERVGVTRATMTGLGHLGRMLPGYCREIAKIMAGMNAQEHETLVKVLSKVRKGLSPVLQGSQL